MIKEIMIKSFLIYAFCLLSSICYGQKNFADITLWQKRILNDVSLVEVKHSLGCDDYVISFEKEDIPSELISILSNWRDERFIIANTDEEYNLTDCEDDSLPFRKLISVIRNEEYAFISYHHGGIGYHTHILWCKISDNNIIDIWICNSYNENVRINDIKKELENFSRIILLKDGRRVKQNYMCF